MEKGFRHKEAKYVFYLCDDALEVPKWWLDLMEVVLVVRLDIWLRD